MFSVFRAYFSHEFVHTLNPRSWEDGEQGERKQQDWRHQGQLWEDRGYLCSPGVGGSRV